MIENRDKLIRLGRRMVLTGMLLTVAISGIECRVKKIKLPKIGIVNNGELSDNQINLQISSAPSLLK